MLEKAEAGELQEESPNDASNDPMTYVPNFVMPGTSPDTSGVRAEQGPAEVAAFV